MWEPDQELQERIMNLAARWSQDDPFYKDDLYQEAMLSIWRKGEGEAPQSHQLQTARNRMISVRKLGKSVDGKLNPHYKRDVRPAVLSLEQDGMTFEDRTLPFEAILPDAFRVEGYVVAKLTFLEIMSYLDSRERRFALLLCQGYSQTEIAASEGLSYRRIRAVMDGVRSKLRLAFRAVAGSKAAGEAL